MSDHATAFFLALQPSFFSSDRLYRVYVSESMLAGAYIAGQLYDAQSAALQLQALGIFLQPLVRRCLEQRRHREEQYDQLNPFGHSFLAEDRRNFHFARSDVLRTRFLRSRSLWGPFNVGVVEVQLLDRTTRRFILVGDQDPDFILRLMQSFDPAIEITGKANPRPHAKQFTPREQRRNAIFVAIVFIVLGAILAWAAVARPEYKAHMPVAVLNIAVGAWCLVQAWRIRSDN